MDEDYKMEGCRTCGVFSPLQYNYLRPLFGTNTEPKMENMLQMLNAWNLEIQENDGMPQYICTQCLSQISQIYEFQRSCIDVKEQLRQWYFKENLNVKIKLENDAEEDVIDNECDYIYIDDCNDYEVNLSDPNKTEELLLVIKSEAMDETVNAAQLAHSVADSDIAMLQHSNNVDIIETTQNIDTSENTASSVFNGLNDIYMNQLNNNNEDIQIEQNQKNQLIQDHWIAVCNTDLENLPNQNTDATKTRSMSQNPIECTLCSFECVTSQQLKQHKASVHAKHLNKRHLLQQNSEATNTNNAHCEDPYKKHDSVLRKEVNSTTKAVEETEDLDLDTAEFVSITFCTDDGELINASDSQKFKESRNYSKQKNCLQTKDKDQASKFKCHVCSRTFGLQFNLNRHLERHKSSIY